MAQMFDGFGIYGMWSVACYMNMRYGTNLWSLYVGWFPARKVYRKSFWMKHWGSRTPKRTVMWSSSKNVCWFRTGKLKKGKGGYKAKGLVTKYKDARGDVKFKGNKRMAQSSKLAYSVHPKFSITSTQLVSLTIFYASSTAQPWFY